MAATPIINIEKLNVIYNPGKSNEYHALKDISLQIYPGEFIIFFGPSGCGKSTLLYSIAGLETGITGNIYVDGSNISSFKPKEIEFYHQKKIGMIFQAYYLIASLTVLKNVILPQIALGTKTKERTQKAIEILKHFGVDQQANKLPSELSGGQQQRVAICRSLMNDPDILLADEPVGNLDSKSSSDVMTLLQDLNEKQKKTIILVTHDPAFLSYAHRVFHLRDGKLIDTTINKTVAHVKPAELTPSISKDLELLLKTYSSILPNRVKNLFIPFKARQIVSEVMLGMTLEETHKIERQVERLLVNENLNSEDIFKFLDENENLDGMGMDKRTARHIAENVKSIISGVKILKEINEEDNAMKDKKGTEIDDNTTQLTYYLFEAFDIKIKDFNIVQIINKSIKERLENKIDIKALQKKLDLSIKKGGAGLDKRLAKRIAQRLELLILGKYE